MSTFTQPLLAQATGPATWEHQTQRHYRMGELSCQVIHSATILRHKIRRGLTYTQEASNNQRCASPNWERTCGLPNQVIDLKVARRLRRSPRSQGRQNVCAEPWPGVLVLTAARGGRELGVDKGVTALVCPRRSTLAMLLMRDGVEAPAELRRTFKQSTIMVWNRQPLYEGPWLSQTSLKSPLDWDIYLIIPMVMKMSFVCWNHSIFHEVHRACRRNDDLEENNSVPVVLWKSQIMSSFILKPKRLF